jgi:cell division protein FtsW (lipid II flippase)
MAIALLVFTHFFVNIAMVIGVFPTIGVPLPFFSMVGLACGDLLFYCLYS